MRIQISRRAASAGFTLTELMIGVCILGLLATIAVPNFFRAQVRARSSIFVANIKQAADAFEMYAWEKRGYPENSAPGVAPDGMEEYLVRMKWSEVTPVGGQWNWDRNRHGYRAGVGVYRPTSPESQFILIDEIIDDGDLSTGYFQSRPDGYVFILEQ